MQPTVVIVGPFINISTDSQASIKAAVHRSRYTTDCYCSTRQLLLHAQQTATGAQGSYCYKSQPTHCSCDKHLARPHINKKKQKETMFLICLVCVLRNECVNK